VAKEMHVVHTQIMNILKRKHEILDDFINIVPRSRQHQRRITGNEYINQLCRDWFQEATGRLELYFCLLNIFIYLCVLFKSYHIEIISSTIN
jgi:hypothetical protein